MVSALEGNLFIGRKNTEIFVKNLTPISQNNTYDALYAPFPMPPKSLSQNNIWML